MLNNVHFLNFNIIDRIYLDFSRASGIPEFYQIYI